MQLKGKWLFIILRGITHEVIIGADFIWRYKLQSDFECNELHIVNENKEEETHIVKALVKI